VTCTLLVPTPPSPSLTVNVAVNVPSSA